MKYELIKNDFELDNCSIIYKILSNRGIALKDIKNYLKSDFSNTINDFRLFGPALLERVYLTIKEAMKENQKTLVVVDSDCDGFTSSAILVNYLYKQNADWVQNSIDWYLHEGKQHGLSDCIEVAKEYDLVLVPDAGSNDDTQLKELYTLGIPVCIFDHHLTSVDPEQYEYASIINNQCSDYPNKEGSGALVVWQFCRYYDEQEGTEYANDFLDLVALGNLADMMSLKSLETKNVINEGFRDIHLKNPFIKGMAQKNAYSLGDHITPMGAAFYIAPFVNAMCRSGNQEEKDLLFRAMLDHKATEIILSNKRGHKPGDEEEVITQALRTVTNVKNRQTRAQDAGMEQIERMIEEDNMLQHSALVFLLKSGEIQAEIRGLIANRIMAKYQRPCCILTLVDNDGVLSYQGSARGYTKTGISNFFLICGGFDKTLYTAGHENAFGLGIPADATDEFIEYLDEELKDYDTEPKYSVDILCDAKNEKLYNDILEIGSFDSLWGQDIDEPYLAIENLKIAKSDITIYKKTSNTLKLTGPNGVTFMKFRISDEECKKFENKQSGYFLINVIGRANINEWNGNTTPQIFIEDYEIVVDMPFEF